MSSTEDIAKRLSSLLVELVSSACKQSGVSRNQAVDRQVDVLSQCIRSLKSQRRVLISESKKKKRRATCREGKQRSKSTRRIRSAKSKRRPQRSVEVTRRPYCTGGVCTYGGCMHTARYGLAYKPLPRATKSRPIRRPHRSRKTKSRHAPRPATAVQRTSTDVREAPAGLHIRDLDDWLRTQQWHGVHGSRRVASLISNGDAKVTNHNGNQQSIFTNGFFSDAQPNGHPQLHTAPPSGSSPPRNDAPKITWIQCGQSDSLTGARDSAINATRTVVTSEGELRERLATLDPQARGIVSQVLAPSTATAVHSPQRLGATTALHPDHVPNDAHQIRGTSSVFFDEVGAVSDGKSPSAQVLSAHDVSSLDATSRHTVPSHSSAALHRINAGHYATVDSAVRTTQGRPRQKARAHGSQDSIPAHLHHLSAAPVPSVAGYTGSRSVAPVAPEQGSHMATRAKAMRLVSAAVQVGRLRGRGLRHPHHQLSLCGNCCHARCGQKRRQRKKKKKKAPAPVRVERIVIVQSNAAPPAVSTEPEDEPEDEVPPPENDLTPSADNSGEEPYFWGTALNGAGEGDSNASGPAMDVSLYGEKEIF